MQPDNEKITQIIDAASENLLRQTLSELIAAGATPHQVGRAAHAIGMFKQCITDEAPFGLVSGAALGAGVLRNESEEEALREQLMELAQEYEEQVQLWEEEHERLLTANQVLQEQLQASVRESNGHSPQVEEEAEELSPREVARSRIRGGRNRLGNKTGFGSGRSRR